MSFAVQPIIVPYPVVLVAETEGTTHHRRAHDEPNGGRSHAHAHTPAPEDSDALPAEVDSPPLVGRLIDVLA